MSMDEVDLQILRKLVWRPDDSADAARGILGPWDIARELAVHGSTVKRRLEAMHEAGLVKGLRVLPHFDLLGIRGALFLFSFPNVEAKKKGFQWMLTKRRPGPPFFLARIDSFVGNEASCAITAFAGANLELLAQEIADEMGAVSWTLLEHETWPFQVEKVTELDKRLLQALHGDALRPISEIATELGVTPKTVRSRLRHLAKAHAFQIVPDMSPARVRGLIPHAILIRPRPGGHQQAVAAFFNAFPHAYIRSHPTAITPYAYLGGFTTKDLEENLSRAANLPQVEEARLLLLEESCPCFGDNQLSPISTYLDRVVGETARRVEIPT